jgi:lipoic acid synthetase
VQPGRASTPPEEDEPRRVAAAVLELGLRHAVLTSVTRDDLEDGGAAHYAETIEAVRAECPGAGVEVLIPDYLGERLETVLRAGPDILAHNVEVVRELTARVRDPRCSYDRSLQVLAESHRAALRTKSSLLLGLGERDDEVERALGDLREVGVDMVCIGQYLQPSRRHLEVDRFVPPERFSELESLARAMGFAAVASGPLVRTSYLAAELTGALEVSS